MMTIGHSNRPMAELLEMLKAHEVDFLVDVRTIPRSNHNPQFNKEDIPKPLALAGIEYIHMPRLGGLRHARKDSVNTGWRNLSFRGWHASHTRPPIRISSRTSRHGVTQNADSLDLHFHHISW